MHFLKKQKSVNTPLIRIEALSKKLCLHDLFVKDESKNPFGTYKDRRSEMILNKAIDECVDKLCLITSGNSGFSLAQFAKGIKIKIVCIVGLDLNQSIKNKLKEACYKVIEVDLSKKILKPENSIALARENDEELIWDVTNGYHDAYESIIKEIKHIQPNYLICPVGSGEAFVGLYKGLKKYNLKTKLIGVTTLSNLSFADKLFTPWTPYTAKIKTILKSGNKIIKLSEQEIKLAYHYATKYIACEPSSAVVIGALFKLNFKQRDAIVIINSGKGLF